MRWMVFCVIVVVAVFGGPLILESANSTCGAFLSRSVREQGGPVLLSTVARNGILGPKWLGPEAMGECTIKYWVSFFDPTQLERLPAM